MTSHYIALIRHGEYHQKAQVPSALQPYSLSRRGEGQAIEAARLIQVFAKSHSLKIHRTVDCSPLLRSWQTAQIIAREINSGEMLLESFDALVERSVGSVANLTMAEIEQAMAADPRFDKPPSNWKTSSDYRLPFYGAESLMQAGERVQQHIQSCINKRSLDLGHASIKLMVGHGASLRHAAYLMGVIAFDDIARLSMHHAHPIIFKVKARRLIHVCGEWKTRDPASAKGVTTESGDEPKGFSD